MHKRQVIQSNKATQRDGFALLRTAVLARDVAGRTATRGHAGHTHMHTQRIPVHQLRTSYIDTVHCILFLTSINFVVSVLLLLLLLVVIFVVIVVIFVVVVVVVHPYHPTVALRESLLEELEGHHHAAG